MLTPGPSLTASGLQARIRRHQSGAHPGISLTDRTDAKSMGHILEPKSAAKMVSVLNLIGIVI